MGWTVIYMCRGRRLVFIATRACQTRPSWHPSAWRVINGGEEDKSRSDQVAIVRWSCCRRRGSSTSRPAWQIRDLSLLSIITVIGATKSNFGNYWFLVRWNGSKFFFSLDLLQLEYRHYRGIVFSNDIYVLCRDVCVYFTEVCREVDTSSWHRTDSLG